MQHVRLLPLRFAGAHRRACSTSRGPEQKQTFWDQFVERLPGEKLTLSAALGFGAMCAVALQKRWRGRQAGCRFRGFQRQEQDGLHRH